MSNTILVVAVLAFWAGSAFGAVVSMKATKYALKKAGLIK